MLRLPELPARERSAELTSKPPPPAVAAADAVSRKLATDRREGGQTSFKPPTTGVPLYPFWCDALFGAEALKKGRARDDILFLDASNYSPSSTNADVKRLAPEPGVRP